MKLRDLYENKEKADVMMDMALFLRALEFSREDAKSDLDLHAFAERAEELTKSRGVLKMSDYDDLIKRVQKSRKENADVKEEEYD